MRFLVDEDVFTCLKFILEEWGHEADAVTLRPKLLSAPDEVLLTRATQEDRIFITFNIEHFEQLHQEYQEAGRYHGGIVVCRDPSGYHNFHRLLGWLRTMLGVVPPAQFPNTLHYLHTF